MVRKTRYLKVSYYKIPIRGSGLATSSGIFAFLRASQPDNANNTLTATTSKIHNLPSMSHTVTFTFYS